MLKEDEEMWREEKEARKRAKEIENAYKSNKRAIERLMKKKNNMRFLRNLSNSTSQTSTLQYAYNDIHTIDQNFEICDIRHDISMENATKESNLLSLFALPFVSPEVNVDFNKNIAKPTLKESFDSILSGQKPLVPL